MHYSGVNEVTITVVCSEELKDNYSILSPKLHYVEAAYKDYPTHMFPSLSQVFKTVADINTLMHIHTHSHEHMH